MVVAELVSGSSPFDVFCHCRCCCVCHNRHGSERERERIECDFGGFV